ncbi:ABC transporter ATP-binding protein [Aureimonas fodinaquatilis]|uniref:ABC transporter ATP-binding protein n=1 Tax=Aureimonas fodinaquatilis TaxID=2565783 RepID=A0A5B0DYQ3_9HYPH|nr:ABC transporter ATP-binding protein [Aureimonas fodinaquatilis]KAA0971957.1 ABC transporter ATP-binding protein [Aureimonas fodinaquatilis]
MRNDARPLSIEGLTVNYGSRRVLDSLELQIGQGEIFGLLGPNGAGKTTLIRTICGRLKPNGGTVEVAGTQGANRLRHIGLAPQELALYSHLTVRENLEVFGRLSGISRHDLADRVAWASDASQVFERLGERVDKLSGGWKRRVNIAAAILHLPALLILDEPTAGVDVEARNRLHEVVVHLSRSGMGVLLATHDLDQAETLCSSVGLLQTGKLVLQGNPRQLIEAAFEEQKEVIVELRQVPGEAHVDWLQQAGFSRQDGATGWVKLGGGAHLHLDDLAKSLSQAGLELKEIRLREPGLHSLFLRLVRDKEPLQ